MHHPLGVIEVRHDGRRACDVARKLGGKSVLERVVRRVTDSERLSHVLVLCCESEITSVRQLVPPDVEVVGVANGDSLSAMVSACQRHAADSLIHVLGDNPFIDPELIDRLITTGDAHPNCDYIGYCRGDGRLAILTHLGMLAEWCAVPALERAARDRQTDRQQPTAFLYGHPELFSIRLVPLPSKLDREDLRFRIDGEEDWEHAHEICDALGHDEWDWRQVVDLLDSHPAVRRRMAHLNAPVERP